MEKRRHVKRDAEHAGKLHPGLVKIKCVGQVREVPALLTASLTFAVHKAPATAGFAVTHVPTGLYIVTRATKAKALNFADQLEADFQDWQFKSVNRISVKARQSYDRIIKGET